MDLVAGAAGALANALLHTKGKLINTELAGGGAGGGLMSKLGAAAASMSPIPIPGLGSSDADSEVTFMFNPTEYSLTRTVTLHNDDADKQVGGNAQFLGTGPLKLSLKLFFDDFASAKGDVTPKINKLFAWQEPGDKKDSPPLVKLEWGTNKMLSKFEGVITSVTANYTVFNKSGTPIQATVDLSIEQAKPQPAPGSNPTSRAKDARRIHVMVEGESLASIAHTEYGNPGYWRALAEFNDIDDPLRVRPGANLIIPSAADAARLA